MSKIENINRTKPLLGFVILGARLIFAKLKQIFIKILILYYFDPQYYIDIKTIILDYTKSEILS